MVERWEKLGVSRHPPDPLTTVRTHPWYLLITTLVLILVLVLVLVLVLILSSLFVNSFHDSIFIPPSSSSSSLFLFPSSSSFSHLCFPVTGVGESSTQAISFQSLFFTHPPYPHHSTTTISNNFYRLSFIIYIWFDISDKCVGDWRWQILHQHTHYVTVPRPRANPRCKYFSWIPTQSSDQRASVYF